MKKTLSVSYYSQFVDNKLSDNLKAKVCAWICVLMALEAIKGVKLNIEDILAEKEAIQDSLIKKGITTKEAIKHGALHITIALLARNHGVRAILEEFKSGTIDLKTGKASPNEFTVPMLETGLRAISESIKGGFPVMISVPKNMIKGNSFHMVLIVGVEWKGKRVQNFYYHDPNSKGNPKNDMIIEAGKFADIWNKTAIFFEKLS